MVEKYIVAENIESFIDKVLEAGKEGYTRIDTMDLSLSIASNYWRVLVAKEDDVEGVEGLDGTVVVVAEPEQVAVEVKKAGRPAKK